MKFLFVGLGSIATKHIRDLISILEKRETEYEIREYTEDKLNDYKVVSEFLSKNIY